MNSKNKKTAPQISTEQSMATNLNWRRFELLTDDLNQIRELENAITKLTRRELAVIVSTLRVRPGFSLSDFDINDVLDS